MRLTPTLLLTALLPCSPAASWLTPRDPNIGTTRMQGELRAAAASCCSSRAAKTAPS
jgi:putative lipoprotein